MEDCCDAVLISSYDLNVVMWLCFREILYFIYVVSETRTVNCLNLAHISFYYGDSIVLQVRMKLQQCLRQWTDYNSSMTQCKEWLQNIEKVVKTLDLKSSLAEKHEQLQTVEVDFCNCRKKTI